MSDPVTEIAYIPLVAGTDLTSGEAKQIWDEVLKTIAAQKGCKAMFWGRQVETPDTVQLVVDWDSIDSHKAFMASPTYPPFLARLQPLLASPPQLFHLKFPPSAPFSVPGSAPTTECISVYFKPDRSAAAYDANWRSFIEAAGKVPNEVQGIAGGWGLEEHTHESLGEKEGEEGKAKFFGGFIGWPSVEAHMEFRKQEAFPGIVGFLREGPVGIKVHHVHFLKY